MLSIVLSRSEAATAREALFAVQSPFSIEKRHPAVGILSIREAIRANQRVRDLEALAVDLLAKDRWTSYAVGTRPVFEASLVKP